MTRRKTLLIPSRINKLGRKRIMIGCVIGRANQYLHFRRAIGLPITQKDISSARALVMAEWGLIRL